jgi:hypothetical protein
VAPVPWKCVKKLFFNKGLISNLILLGKADKHDFFQKKCQAFFTQTLFLIVCQKILPQ